jgi:hypothetical protein
MFGPDRDSHCWVRFVGHGTRMESQDVKQEEMAENSSGEQLSFSINQVGAASNKSTWGCILVSFKQSNFWAASSSLSIDQRTWGGILVSSGRHALDVQVMATAVVQGRVRGFRA